MSLPDVIIFDFDGVIVESNDVKHKAFEQTFKKYENHFDEIMEYHYSHNATDRYAKFDHISKNILKINDDKETRAEWIRSFTEKTREGVINCPFVDGAIEFLEYFSGKLPLYVSSATPDEELNIILEKRDLDKYFKKAIGSSLKKTDAISKILEVENVQKKDVLFIGDSPEDQKSARSSGVKFVGRNTGYLFEDDPSFDDLKGILNFLLNGE